jgi:divalent metal cation (Fe/Co/Zn/Cd) transporter
VAALFGTTLNDNEHCDNCNPSHASQPPTPSRSSLAVDRAALATIGLKTLAWWLTGSVGLLSDAWSRSVNLAAALLALSMLRLAYRLRRESSSRSFEAEYLAAGIEGALIVLAAAGIIASAVPRLSIRANCRRRSPALD